VTVLPAPLTRPLAELLLALADDKFFLGHRNADWTGLAPILEEDIAFSSLAQDELAHAQALYQLVANLTGSKADWLAFGRKPEEYRCAEIVELSDEFDWATALARNLFCDHFDALRLDRLARSSYTPLANLAVRLRAEEQIHLDHDASWMGHLGRGGEEARRRIQESLDRLAPLASMLFEPSDGQSELEKEGIYPGSEDETFAAWSKNLEEVARPCQFSVCLTRRPLQSIGGRRGRHSASFAALLDELAEVFRLEPEAAW